MQLTYLIYPLLSLFLMLGGAALTVHAGRAARKIVSARVDMIAPATADTVAEAARGKESAALVRAHFGGGTGPEVAEVARTLSKLKLDPRQATSVLIALRLGSALVVALAAYFVLRNTVHGGFAFGASALGALAGAILGYLAPTLVVAMRASHRRQAVVSGFPEALELMVVCVEAGLALEESIERIAVELALSQPELAEELEQTSADLKILPDRDQALRNMADRVGAPSVRSVMITLSQTLRFGTPLAQGLRVAASELRNDSMLALEERANRLPTLLTIPMMLCIMPTIFLVVAGPAVIRVLDVLASR